MWLTYDSLAENRKPTLERALEIANEQHSCVTVQVSHSMTYSLVVGPTP